MRRLTKGFLLTVAFTICLATVSQAVRAYDYIDITNPFLRKIPAAVPVFKSMIKVQSR